MTLAHLWRLSVYRLKVRAHDPANWTRRLMAEVRAWQAFVVFEAGSWLPVSSRS